MLINLSEFDIRLLSDILSDVMNDLSQDSINDMSNYDFERLKFIEKFFKKLQSDN